LALQRGQGSAGIGTENDSDGRLGKASVGRPGMPIDGSVIDGSKDGSGMAMLKEIDGRLGNASVGRPGMPIDGSVIDGSKDGSAIAMLNESDGRLGKASVGRPGSERAAKLQDTYCAPLPYSISVLRLAIPAMPAGP
jgi:hypothetical protein